jgi:hypothetical protein
MSLGGTIEYFRDTVFNYPTMAECYKVAALDGLNKLSLWADLQREATSFIPLATTNGAPTSDAVPVLT